MEQDVAEMHEALVQPPEHLVQPEGENQQRAVVVAAGPGKEEFNQVVTILVNEHID